MPLLTPEERIGTTVGTWVLERLIGEGGMGVVYAARHGSLGTKVAVKLLHPHLLRSESVSKRFEREAQAAAAIEHPNVVRIIDVLTAEDGARCIVMDLLEGESLHARLRRGGALTTGQASRYLLPVMDALAKAHAAGIVHRDLKPDNVFLSREGEHVVPKLLDFGIAKLLGGDSTATRTGMLMGTPAYMSPEQARGSKKVGPRADVWAMGCVWFECLTGRTPFQAETPQGVLAAILTESPPPVRQVAGHVPLHFAEVIDRALSRDPEERFATMAEFAAELQNAAVAREGEAHASTHPPPGPDTVVSPSAPTMPTPVAADPSTAPTVLGADPSTAPTMLASSPATPRPRRARIGVVVGAFVVLLAAGVATIGPGVMMDAEPMAATPIAQSTTTTQEGLALTEAPAPGHPATAGLRRGEAEGRDQPTDAGGDADGGDAGSDASEAMAAASMESSMASMAAMASMDTMRSMTAMGSGMRPRRLSDDTIRAVLRSRRISFKQCGFHMRAAMREFPPMVRGSFTIGPDGRPGDIEVGERTTPASLRICVQRVIQTLRFPEARSSTRYADSFDVTPL